ncbi:MAG: hypothetical protein Q8P49_00880 [Candidatus Liptonbacteria bacterium]|nr:hypothetical protein [Candidatus Liptonbacteria bacterium]
MTKNRAIFAAFLMLTFAAPVHARAAAGAAVCDLPQSEFDALLAVQNDPKLSYLDELRAELRLRKSLLSKTVDCAIQRASALKAELKATPVADEEMRNAQTRMMNRIDDVLTYYSLEREKIPDLGLEGSKRFASNLEAWRAGNYAPITRTTSNIMLWSGNQNLIAIAKSRMNQMGYTIGLLNLIGNNGLQELWNGAQESFKTTLSLNREAHDALINSGGGSQTLDLIKSSLGALSDTYQKLFELGNALTNAPEK